MRESVDKRRLNMLDWHITDGEVHSKGPNSREKLPMQPFLLYFNSVKTNSTLSPVIHCRFALLEVAIDNMRSRMLIRSETWHGLASSEVKSVTSVC